MAPETASIFALPAASASCVELRDRVGVDLLSRAGVSGRVLRWPSTRGELAVLDRDLHLDGPVHRVGGPSPVTVFADAGAGAARCGCWCCLAAGAAAAAGPAPLALSPEAPWPGHLAEPPPALRGRRACRAAAGGAVPSADWVCDLKDSSRTRPTAVATIARMTRRNAVPSRAGQNSNDSWWICLPPYPGARSSRVTRGGQCRAARTGRRRGRSRPGTFAWSARRRAADSRRARRGCRRRTRPVALAPLGELLRVPGGTPRRAALLTR